MNQLDKNEGGYVFISHSHQDIEKVRQIRNTMEDNGFEPLCFYLKCLTDEDEIEGLIKREIDAREWFVFVDSPNSRASRWVTKEREYISSLETKKIITICLDNETSMSKVAEKLVKGLRVSVFCSEVDSEFAYLLRDKLLEKEIQVGLIVCEQMKSHNMDTINNFADYGTLIMILSNEGIKSRSFDVEIKRIVNSGADIISISLDGFAISEYWNMNNKCKENYYIEGADKETWINELVRKIEFDIACDLNKAFSQAESHREISQYYMKTQNNPEAERMAQEAHDRLDEKERIKDDILKAIEQGTMKMTDKVKKFLES